MFSYVVSSNSAQYILCGFNRKNQCAPSPPLFNQIIFIKLSFLNRKVFYSLSHSAVFYYQKKKVCNMEQNKELYEKRQKRRQDAIELKQPDMVPVNYLAQGFMVNDSGHTMAEAAYDFDIERNSVLEFASHYDPDLMVLLNENYWGLGKDTGTGTDGAVVSTLWIIWWKSGGCGLVDTVNTLTDKRGPGGDKCFFIMGKLWK